MNDEDNMLEVKHRKMMMTNKAFEGHHLLHHQHNISDIEMRKREWLRIISFLKAVRFLSTPIMDMRTIKAANVRR